MRKVFVALLLFDILFCLPFFLNISTTFPRLYSDYDAILPIYQYIGTYFRLHHAFPSIIPFVAGGIPILGDPVTGIFNPLTTLPLIFFDVNISIRITFFLVILFSGITMYFFLQKIKVSKVLQYWGSFLYMSSGIIVACISAGHITEKFLSIPLIPLLFLLELDKEVTIKKTFFVGLVIAATIYCGDIYGTWFFFIFLFLIEGFYFFKYSNFRFKRIISFLGVGIIFLIFSSPLIYPFVTNVLPIMRRPTYVNPFLGSIHFFLLPLQFIMPLQINFYDRPFFQRHLGFYYNWYEYYGFLGFFPIFFFKNIKKVLRDVRIQLLLILILAGSLYLSSGFIYSPFHWIFTFWKGSNVFRVPQRIVIPLTPVVIALFCLLAMKWKKKVSLYTILSLSILWTVGVGWFTFSQTFVPQNQELLNFVNKFAKIDTDHAEVANFLPFTQYYITENGIPIHNYYYAWVPKTTLQIDTHEGAIYKDAIVKAKIKYILSTDKKNFSDMGYKKVMKYKEYIVWAK
ncbi:MAG TPA: hypothetical protein VF189_01890 [Patescibacteria group bacterium]